MAFAGFAALLAPVAPPPFAGLSADRRAAAPIAATCVLAQSLLNTAVGVASLTGWSWNEGNLAQAQDAAIGRVKAG